MQFRFLLKRVYQNYPAWLHITDTTGADELLDAMTARLGMKGEGETFPIDDAEDLDGL